MDFQREYGIVANETDGEGPAGENVTPEQEYITIQTIDATGKTQDIGISVETASNLYAAVPLCQLAQLKENKNCSISLVFTDSLIELLAKEKLKTTPLDEQKKNPVETTNFHQMPDTSQAESITVGAEKPIFHCSFEGCTKKYLHLRNLNSHTRAMHGDNPLFKCKICNRKFGSNQNLDRHTETFRNATYPCNSNMEAKRVYSHDHPGFSKAARKKKRMKRLDANVDEPEHSEDNLEHDRPTENSPNEQGPSEFNDQAQLLFSDGTDELQDQVGKTPCLALVVDVVDDNE